ncbi:polycomb group protein ASXL1 [Hyperolius riggenbachi]|uniref:polycomb group protein ASXL1 n=1 Tax=Hyperolius riggenbachi TaxID=752182 RepID=UPI0035A38C57
MRDKQKRRRERTWAEAAKMVLENYSDAPMTPKQILNVIEAEGLKETKNGSSPLACLNSMLHSNSRTREALFYKLPGRISLFTMKKNAVQWSRVVSLPDDGDTEDTADEETSQWSESNTVTAGESSGSASSSQDCHMRETRSLVQKRRSGVLLPRVVLTPLKVNGAHLPSTSGLSVRRVESESPVKRALGSSLTFHRRAALSGNNTHHLRSIKSPSVPGHVKKNKDEEIDFETPGSILVNTNLRALINVRTFNALPHNLQQQLLLLLPDVDRQVTPDGQMKMSGSALNNEFFAHACQRWRERLGDGEFTPEMQQRMKQEMGKEKKVEDWKETFFEDFYGQKLGLSEDLGSDRDDKCSQSDSICEAVQRISPEPIHVEEPVPEIQVRTRRAIYRNRARLRQTRASASEVKTVAPPESSKDAFPALEDRLSPAEAGALPSTSDRVPDLHPETSEQKRKITEPESSNPSPEKRPRMEQRQSFRNTITSVHPEKPQPTKEEPKVPPIRIQLSRIKPPWVVKGLPAYQICPRIIPNTDPPGMQPPPGSPSDSQTSGRDLQTSIGGGGGPGGGKDIGERSSSWSRDSRRKSNKRRHGKKPTNCSRTQLLPSTPVRDTSEKPQVPRVKITCTKSPPEAKEHGFPGAMTKEWHVSEVVASEVGSGTPSSDCCTVGSCEKATSLGDQDATANQVMEKPRGGPLASLPVGESVGHGNLGQSVEPLSSVLGDVSNTFQNRIQSITSNLVEKESLEKNSVMISLQPNLHESSRFSAVDLHPVENAQATQTSTEPWLAECSEGTSTSKDSEHCGSACNFSDGDPVPESVPCKPSNASYVLDIRKASVFDSLDRAVSDQIYEPMGSLCSPSSETGEHVPGQTTHPCSLQTDMNTVISAGGSLSLNAPSEHLKDSLPPNATLSSKDSDFLANVDEPIRSCSHASALSVEPVCPGKPLSFEGGKLEMQSPQGRSPTLYSRLDICEERLMGVKDSCGKRKHFLANCADSVDQDPLFLDVPFMPFTKGVDVRVELPVDLSSLSPPNKPHQSLLGKLTKQAQDVASYCYSAGVRLSAFHGEYAVTGRASLSVEVFAEHESGEQVSVRCSCSFKAMTICEGCGAFCHIDCIGPSKLCVLCLVIR